MDNHMTEIIKVGLDVQFGCGDMVDIGDKEAAAEIITEDLEKAGYGNVKQAVKEFADYARQVIVKQFSDTEMEKIKTVGALQLLYNKIEELYEE